jgi:hypothetical protein
MKVCATKKKIGIRVTDLIRILKLFSNQLKPFARRIAVHITMYFFVKSYKLKPAKYHFGHKLLIVYNYSATYFGSLGQFSTSLK